MRWLYQFERACVQLRHSRLLKHTTPLWRWLRPAYDALIKQAGNAEGLLRNINGTDPVRILPAFRNLPETYEPEIWSLVMAQVQPGSKVIDVGAHIGLYAMALGKRVGKAGQVLAAEPDPVNLTALSRHIALNQLEKRVTVLPAALSDQSGEACLATNDMQSHVSGAGDVAIKLTTLDQVVLGEHWDLMLIDVEGHEEKVLLGAQRWLSDVHCRPEQIVIEVHPYAWPALGTSSESLLTLLRRYGYEVTDPGGKTVEEIKVYGHIIAKHRRG